MPVPLGPPDAAVMRRYHHLIRFDRVLLVVWAAVGIAEVIIVMLNPAAAWLAILLFAQAVMLVWHLRGTILRRMDLLEHLRTMGVWRIRARTAGGDPITLEGRMIYVHPADFGQVRQFIHVDLDAVDDPH